MCVFVGVAPKMCPRCKFEAGKRCRRCKGLGFIMVEIKTPKAEADHRIVER